MLKTQLENLNKVKKDAIKWLDEELIDINQYCDIMEYYDQNVEKLNKLYTGVKND